VFPVSLFALIVSLSPFSGPPPSGSVPGTAKFAVDVSGESGQAVRLRAVGVPRGYIASFCTRRVCAPFNVSFALPESGRESIELQLIENVAGARRPTLVTVAADGAHTASILFSRAAH
jgi:hypothetical protein